MLYMNGDKVWVGTIHMNMYMYPQMDPTEWNGARLVAVQNSQDSSQPQLVAVQGEQTGQDLQVNIMYPDPPPSPTLEWGPVGRRTEFPGQFPTPAGGCTGGTDRTRLTGKYHVPLPPPPPPLTGMVPGWSLYRILMTVPNPSWWLCRANRQGKIYR